VGYKAADPLHRFHRTLFIDFFDYTTYFMMLYIFNCWDTSTPQAAAHSASLFQTGWFVESLLTQTLIIHIIRTNRIPFLQSRASWPLIAMSASIMAIGVAIPFTWLGGYLGFTSLPPLYWPLLGLTLACYVVLTQTVKTWLFRKAWLQPGAGNDRPGRARCRTPFSHQSKPR